MAISWNKLFCLETMLRKGFKSVSQLEVCPPVTRGPPKLQPSSALGWNHSVMPAVSSLSSLLSLLPHSALVFIGSTSDMWAESCCSFQLGCCSGQAHAHQLALLTPDALGKLQTTPFLSTEQFMFLLSMSFPPCHYLAHWDKYFKVFSTLFMGQT